jgi:serine phosphatase RsbU (regulator of sigma subunit)/predicted enzyme related to lactoylglutathione lyase
MDNSPLHSGSSPGFDCKKLHLSLHHVIVCVRDLDKSMRFYLDQLGFNLMVDAKYEGGRWVGVTPPDGTTNLGLIAPKPDSPEYQLIGKSNGIVFLTDDVHAKYNEWCKRGVHFLHPPYTPAWGGVFTVFQDLDSNSFALVGRDELTRFIEAQRREVAEKQEAERRTAQELAIAKQVQARLFPQTLPRLKTLDYAGICIQARQVGGDYYDFLHLGRERLGLVIGDISGKGIAAALLMVNLQANLRSQSAIALDEPQRLLRSVNQLFYENTTDSDYASLFFAEYDDKVRRIRYANCGHLSALLFRGDDTLERLDSTCTVVGLFKEWDCYMGERKLFPGDTLVLYTDGVTESINDAGEEFGEQRLIESMERGRELSSQELVASLVHDVQHYSPNSQYDDITLIVAKCREN